MQSCFENLLNSNHNAIIDVCITIKQTTLCSDSQ